MDRTNWYRTRSVGTRSPLISLIYRPKRGRDTPLELLSSFAQELENADRETFIDNHPLPYLLIDRYEPIHVDIRSPKTIHDENPEDSKLLRKKPGSDELYTSPAAQVIEVTLDDDQMFTLGRNPDGGVLLEHPRISRNHSAIRQSSDGEWELGDIGSTNGTFVRGERLDRDQFVPLAIGEVFILAGIVACTVFPPEQLFDLAATLRSSRHD